MPIESILFLALVIGALGVFTATLSYGQWVTRNVVQDGTSAVAKPLQVPRKSSTASPEKAARVYEEAL